MAKTKAELLDEAKKLGIEVDEKAKVAEIKALIDKNEIVILNEDEGPRTESNEISLQARDDSKKAQAVSDTEETQKPATEPEEGPQVAKAGKRSAKSIKEAEEKQAKEERKASGETEAPKPKKVAPPTRSRLERRAKGYRKSAEQLEKDKSYTVEQAVALAKKTSHVKFDATVEAHINLGVDPRHADQNIRDNLVLPHGSGKKVRVAVASDELLAQLDKNQIDFDVLVATPEFMPKLGKYARVLGPKGLMPNPKSGTVTTDVDKAAAEAQAGRVEYRVDSTGIVHLGIGKVSFTEAQLQENLQALVASIKANKPNSVKGNYIKSAHLTTSMGPSIAIDVANLG